MTRADASSGPAARPSASDWATLDGALQGWVDEGFLPCVSVQAFDGTGPLHAFRRGLRDLEGGLPVERDTVFAIYSMTKPVTAAAMMVLYDRGLWRPDEPIARVLPEFADLRGPGGAALERAPTLGELMTHTAGLAYGLPIGLRDAADESYIEADLWGAPDLAEFSARLARLPLAYAPGATWRYSLSMDLQGAVIERLSGLPLERFMRDEVFGPLGMADTGFSVPEHERGRLAKVYSGLFTPGLSELAEPRFSRTGALRGFPSGGGGLYSTLDDYVRFARMLLARGAAPGGRLLSEEAVALMTTNHLPDWMMEARLGSGPQQFKPGFGYGYNGSVFVDPVRAGIAVGAGTYQWDGASSVWFWVDRANDLGFVAMTNRIMQEDLPRFQATSQNILGRALQGSAARAGARE